jgi:hypothetical protein
VAPVDLRDGLTTLESSARRGIPYNRVLGNSRRVKLVREGLCFAHVGLWVGVSIQERTLAVGMF